MAGIGATPPAADWHETREQLAAVARFRWQIFANSLRSLRGRLEMVSGILMGAMYAMFALGGMAGFGVISWFMVSRGGYEWLSVPLWAVLGYWQLFPLLTAAFTEIVDFTGFLRFPLRYRNYVLIRMLFSLLDPATIVSSAWLLGMAAGIAAASARLLLWAAPALAAFWAFNFCLGRALFAWTERWLAQRRTREILGILFFLCIVAVQFIGPLTRAYENHRSRPFFEPASEKLLAVERALPPGLAGVTIARAARGEMLGAAGAFAGVCVYAGLFLGLLDLRLRAQYRGESLSEAPAPAAAWEETRKLHAGWKLPGLSGPASAVFEKEIHYLSRSGPVLFTLVMPAVILLILRVSAASAPHGRRGPVHFSLFAFPFGAAYAMLILTNMIYNSLGADAEGVQAFFVSPVLFREILLGKNMAQAAVLILEIVLVWVGASVLFGKPAMSMTLATLAAIFFAAMVNFAVGNVMSLLLPRKVDLALMGRQRGSGAGVLAALGVQVVTFGVAGSILLLAAHWGRLWLAVPLLLALGGLSCAGYAYALRLMERIALAHREAILAELCRS